MKKRRVLDIDAHVMEPADLFSDLLPTSALRLNLPSDTPVLFNGRLADAAEQIASGFDAQSFLHAMDRERIDCSIVFPSLGLWAPFHPTVTPRMSRSVCRRYNEWVADYCAADPTRLFPIGLVPLADPELAAGEIVELALGPFVGIVMRPNELYGRNPGDPCYDPFYAAACQTRMVVAVHEGLGLHTATVGADRFSGFGLRHACSHPMEGMCALASFAFADTFDRFPELRVGFFESGAGWIPYWLNRLQGHLNLVGKHGADFLEQFDRNCFASVDPDEADLAYLAHALGPRHLAFASDFPHPDCLYPNALETFLTHARGLSDDELTACLWDTGVDWFNLSRYRLGSAVKYSAPERDEGAALELRDAKPFPLRFEPPPARLAFVSPEWIDFSQQLIAGSGTPTLVEGPDNVTLNFCVQLDSGGSREFHVTCTPDSVFVFDGALENVATSVELDEAAARALLLDGDQSLAIAAFTEGRLKISGSLGHLLAAQQAMANPNPSYAEMLAALARYTA